MKKDNTWMIINPKSGGGNAIKQKELIVEKSLAVGWKGKYKETTKIKSARDWVNEAVRAGIKEIIIGGGDGSIQNILKVAIDNKLTVGIIPLGTGNVLARNLQIPLDTEEAIKVALHGKIINIDIGEANGNYFGVIAGMGVDVNAMEQTKKSMKDRFGILAYLWTGLKSLTKSREKYRVIIDEKDKYTFKAKSIMVANMAETIEGIEMAPGAGFQTGDLKVIVIKTKSKRSWINLLINTLRGDINKSPYYELYMAKNKVEIFPLTKKRNYELDGDVFEPVDKLEIIIHPKALKVRIPTQNIGSRVVEQKKKVLIFDFDGTLADTFIILIKVFNKICKKYNLDKIDSKQAEELRGQSARNIVEILKIKKLKLPALLTEGRKEFIKEQENVNIFPEIKEVLLKLKKQYGLGIVTSNEVENVNIFLKKNDLQIFDFIYSDKSIFGKGKILKKLIKKYDFKNEQLIYIGDEVRDIEAAREGEIKVVAVGWGFNTTEVLLEHKPDWFINKPSDLTKIKF